MNTSIIIGIILMGLGTILGTYFIQKGRTQLAFKSSDKIIKHINETDSINRTTIIENLNLNSDEIIGIVKTQTQESKLDILSKLENGFDDVQKGTNEIADILTGGNTYPSFRLTYRPNSNQLQFNLQQIGKHKLPYKLIQIYNLSINRDRDMINVSRPGEQYLIEKTNEYAEFYIEGSTTVKLNSWLFEVITKKGDFVYLLIKTTSENGSTRQIYYVDNFRDDNFYMDYYKLVEGISGVNKDKILESHIDRGIKLLDNKKPIPDIFIPPFWKLNASLKRDWESRKDVHIPDGWSSKK